MDQKKIGSFIAARRKDNGLTQSQLAEKLGITDKAISKWETGKSMPDLSLFNPLCNLLQIILNELLLGEFISDENLKEKSNQVLFEVVTSWLGKDQWESKTDTQVPTVLKLKKVRKIYETESTSTEAVKDVSFEITKGNFVGIMGASGSGKTTLLNMIATIDKATSGQIEIDGQSVSELSENDLASFRREHLGFVFQEYNLIDTLTVYENIALALTIKQMPKESVKQKTPRQKMMLCQGRILYENSTIIRGATLLHGLTRALSGIPSYPRHMTSARTSQNTLCMPHFTAPSAAHLTTCFPPASQPRRLSVRT